MRVLAHRRATSDWVFNILARPLLFFTRPLRADYRLDGHTLTVTRPFRRRMTLPLDDLDEIGLETTDEGPFVEDVYLILQRGATRIRIGEPHPVFAQLLEHFQSLEGFDWNAVIEAMACTECCYFTCWKRAETSA